MNCKSLILIIGLLLQACSYKQYVLFGETTVTNDNSIAVCFDRFGDLYPDMRLEDKEIKKSCATLSGYFQSNEGFKQKLRTYCNMPNCDSFDLLQDVIIAKKANKINEILKNNKIDNLTIIMVGYNKAFKDAKSNLDKLKKIIEGITQKTLVIELFWDGTNKRPPLTNFSYATTISYYAGLGLRQLIEKIDCNNINLISHSLGANVICEALFNQISKVTNYDGVKDYLSLEYKKGIYRTPTLEKKITVALVAPAIPGYNTFIDYYDRTEKVVKDNYRFIIGYNINDEVLRKHIGNFAIDHFGSTSLGCNVEEVNAVLKLFRKNYNTSKIDTIDFSNAGKSHSLLNYMKSPQYIELLKQIYGSVN